MTWIQKKTGEEGEIFNKWLHSRLIENNKNVISAELGATGSGKSYRDLRKAELWYKYHFKEEFPVDNICFGVGKVMQKLASGELRRGEILIVEEAGVNLGSRGWQSKISKMFNYVLQSFRSMNIAIFFNLPYLSMLDSQARHLLHYYAESVKVDKKTGINQCKPFFVQVAQGTGKVYRHYPKVTLNGRTIKVKRFNWKMPSQYLVDAYEDKKQKYLQELTKGYAEEINGKKKEITPSEVEIEAYALRKKGKTFDKIAKELEIARQTASLYAKKVEKWIEVTKNDKNSKKMEELLVNI